MKTTHEDKYIEELKIDCEKCFGLCCTALYFSASEGFPSNKNAGKPCKNLQQDFTCSIHKNLRNKGFKGCTAYDCFGAGQKVAQITFGGHDWREKPESANKMFDAFLIMRQLHEMMWYLSQAVSLQVDNSIREKIALLLDETEALTLLDLDSLFKIDIDAHRTKVNVFLKSTSEMIRSKACSKKNGSRKNGNSKMKCYLGKDLRKSNLVGADLRGALLIAANLRDVDLTGADLIGADLRDTDVSGANLKNSIFLTQNQINHAKGDSNTKLPENLTPPSYWLSK